MFGLANAGVSFIGLTGGALLDRITLGVLLGLVLGKLIGVFGTGALTVRLGFAGLPRGASWVQFFGVPVLCGIGFTMSLFVGLLAFASDPALQTAVKVGIVAGSLVAGSLGFIVLRFAPSQMDVAQPAFRPVPPRVDPV